MTEIVAARNVRERSRRSMKVFITYQKGDHENSQGNPCGYETQRRFQRHVPKQGYDSSDTD